MNEEQKSYIATINSSQPEEIFIKKQVGKKLFYLLMLIIRNKLSILCRER